MRTYTKGQNIFKQSKKTQDCKSNSEVLIRPGNSDVSAQFWERFGGICVMWKFYYSVVCVHVCACVCECMYVLCVRDMHIQRCRHASWHTQKQILKQTLMYVKVSIIMVCNQHVPDPNKHEQTPSQLGRDCFSVCFLFVFCLFVGIQPQNPYVASRPGLEPRLPLGLFFCKTPGSVSTHVA